MKNFSKKSKTLLFASLMYGVPSFFATAQTILGALESPSTGSVQSGIGVIRGWHCSATRIEITIDGISKGFTYTGSQRFDTTLICGKSETGFSYLINYNDSKLTPGWHTVRAYANGEKFGEASFQNLQSGGEEYLTGINKQTKVLDFPKPGSSVILSWQEDKQNFAITGIELNRETPRTTISSVGFITGTDGSTKIQYSITNNSTQSLGKVDIDIYCTTGTTGLSFLKQTSYIPTNGILAPGSTEVSSFFYYSPNFIRYAPPRCTNINNDIFINPGSIYNTQGTLIY